MLYLILPAVLGGLLGVLANGAEDAAAYVPRLRLMFLGAVGLGFLGLALFTWLRTTGWRRYGALLLALVTIRLAYVPAVSAALVLTSWLDWGARMFGAEKLAVPVHYSLACFVAAFAELAALAAVAAAANVKRAGSVVVLLAFAAFGVLVFWHPADRTVSPHPFADQAFAPSERGPEYLDVVEDGEQDAVTRILAAGGGLRHAVMGRRGWGATVRKQLLDRYRGNPELTLGDRITCLEAALLRARSTLVPPEPGPEDTPQ